MILPPQQQQYASTDRKRDRAWRKSTRDWMKEMWTGNSLEVTESGLRGWVTFQKEENKRSRVKRFCVIKGTTLVSHVSDKVGSLP